jgi:hypothetical protein
MSEPAHSDCGIGEQVDVRQIMAAIRLRVRRSSLRNEDAQRRARRSISSELLARVSRLNARIETIRAHAGRIGELPPHPPTFRGRIGAVAVRLVRRALFWFIPSLQIAQNEIVQALEDQIKVNEELMKSLEQVHLQIELMQSQTEAPAVSIRTAGA